MSTGRENISINNHLGANPSTNDYTTYKTIMAKLSYQLEKEAAERKARKEKKRG